MAAFMDKLHCPMKYALILGLMSLVLVGAGFTHPQTAWVWWWTGGSFALVALGYAHTRLGASVLGKRANGRIAPLHKLLLFPYLAFTWTVWHLYRLLDRTPATHRIADDLVVGRRLLPHELPGEFAHYVDLTAEFEEPKSIRNHASYFSLPVLDADVPGKLALRAACQRMAVGRVYVHCAQGHGRTGMFAAALLAERGVVTSASQALNLLRQQRPGINWNARQRQFMEEYFQETVAQLQTTPISVAPQMERD